MHAYFPSTCATRAFEMRKYLVDTAIEHNIGAAGLYRFHSFGFRGHRSLEDAYWAGKAWSTYMPGTDDAHISLHMPSTWNMGSIMALAHKVTQQYDNEEDCFVRAVDVASKTDRNIVALVIDTYNADNVIENMVVNVTERASHHGVHVVWRPDSGDLFGQAATIISKLKGAGLENGSVIIGEGMSFENAKQMDAAFIKEGIDISKISYGIGSGYYKDMERDTLGWAMKTAYSNNKNRMKLVESCELKQSIPGEVELLRRDSDGAVVAAYKEENLSFKGYTKIYQTIYELNSMLCQYFKTQENPDVVFDLSMSTQLKKDIIELSEMIQEEIISFKEKYSKKNATPAKQNPKITTVEKLEDF